MVIERIIVAAPRKVSRSEEKNRVGSTIYGVLTGLALSWGH